MHTIRVIGCTLALLAACRPGMRTAPLRVPSPAARQVTRDSVAGLESIADSIGRPVVDGWLQQLCPTSRPRPGTGAVLGEVRHRRDDSPLAGIEVMAAWRGADSTFAGSGSRPRLRTRTDSSGRFLLCQVPRFTPVELWAPADTTADERLRVQLGARLLIWQDLAFDTGDAVTPDAEPPPATGAIQGRILTMVGDGLPNVSVRIDQPARTVLTDIDGRFVVTDVPPGIRAIDVRAIGYRPQRLGISVRAGERVTSDLTIDRGSIVLGTVLVRADRRIGWDSLGFEERRRKGTGYFFGRESLAGLTDLSTALRMVPGIRGRSNERSQRIVAGRGAGCFPSFVVNRVRFEAGGSIGPEAMIRAEDIRAMEVYTSRLATPPEYQRYGDCAVIVIWLRDPQREREASRRR